MRSCSEPGQPVQARHHQDVAGPDVVQARGQLRSVGGAAGQLVGEHLDAADLLQRPALPVE